MRTHAQAVVIGGGVVGCSILYHLAKARLDGGGPAGALELTSGSTWHAAANIHGLHDVTNISRLQHYTMSLYKELEAETGQSCGVFQPGSFTSRRPRTGSTSCACRRPRRGATA
jgi:dimethylglycine dehydrogenase